MNQYDDVVFRKPPGQRRFDIPLGFVFKCIAVLVLAVVVAIPAFWWFAMRIEVNQGEFVVLIRKTGTDITNDQILAPDADHKGPQRLILKEGRHFRNPYTWNWTRAIPATVIQQGQVGIKVRKFGKPLEPGRILATDSTRKGILPDILTPGRYYLNTYEYDVQVVDMVKIEPGYMGVVTLKVGAEAKDPHAFIAGEGERGVQPALLFPGTHPRFSNPYLHLVTQIDVRSQKFEMKDQYAISFPSLYGFDIMVEGMIEWAPKLEKLPELFVKYVDETDLEASGGINNIQQKVILPFARSYFRTIGGKYRAVDYITGDTRIVVQNKVEQDLKSRCGELGIDIKSVVIKSTEPPSQIRDQFQRREIAKRKKEAYEKQIEMQIGSVVMIGQTPKLDADGNKMLDEHGDAVMIGGEPKVDADGEPVREGGRLTQVIQERKKDRAEQIGTIRESIATQIREADKYRNVEVTQANRDVTVAKINLEAAKDRAAGVKAEGLADAAVMVMEFKAEAEGVTDKVAAFGTGDKYATNLLINKLAPGISEILSNTEGPFAKLFERFASLGSGSDESAKSKKPKKD
ncbi:MAG: SPFH domain-containing protein [Phycisphaerae bacterium]|nr:SPFH domain-containing protein [Phycisphaerae bacterium]